MDLLDKGKHCDEESCHQLDFLPLKCKGCEKYYCSEHFKYDLHQCKNSERFNRKVLNDDSNITKPMLNKCGHTKCKSKEFINFKCNLCEKSFCTKHRIPEDHTCSGIVISCSQEFSKKHKNLNKKYFGVSSF